jgi:hypothetical protein
MLKSISTEPLIGGWSLPNDGADNSSGFTAVPGGHRDNGGGFGWNGYATVLWTSTAINGPPNSGASSRYLYSSSGHIFKTYAHSFPTGLSVRCLRDSVSSGTSMVIPTVTTSSFTAVTSNSATTGGDVVQDGGAPVTARGVAYGTSSSPTTSGSITNDGTGMGVFTSTLAGLTPSTTYYVRAYATNSVGTAYGNEVSFTTSSYSITIDTLATWELTGLNVTSPAWGPSPLPAQNASSSVSTPGWTRGSGVLLTAAGVATTGTPTSNAWGGNGWDAYTLGGASSLDSTIARGDFVSITFTITTGATVGFSSIPAYTIRRSSSGPATGQWQYSVGTSGSFVNIGSPITWGTVTTATGNPQTAIDLSGIADLQNLGGGTTVTFRIVNMGATSSGGTWYFNQGTAAGRDLTFIGTSTF